MFEYLRKCLINSDYDICVLAGCELWTREEGVASLGGTSFPLMSLSDCLKLCLEMSTCVAVDFSQAVCGVHTNINDTAVTFRAAGFTQYTVNRACLSSTLTSASSTSSAASTETSTPVGKSVDVFGSVTRYAYCTCLRSEIWGSLPVLIMYC